MPDAPDQDPPEEITRAYLETRRRIRDIEQRALKKLRGKDGDE